LKLESARSLQALETKQFWLPLVLVRFAPEASRPLRCRAFSHRFGGEEQGFPHVLRFEVRIEGKDLLNGLFGNEGHNCWDGNSEPAQAGDTAHLARIDRNACEFHDTLL
jgi:hypothetical protein